MFRMGREVSVGKWGSLKENKPGKYHSVWGRALDRQEV